MRLYTGLFQETIEINEGEAVSLVIENPSIFYRLMSSLYEQVNGDEGELVLSQNNSEVKISKSIELITSFIPFDLSEKRIITKICSLLEDEATNDINYAYTMKIMADIEKYVYNLSDELPYKLRYNGLNIAAIIRMCGVQIEDDSLNPIEKVIYYMDLVRELFGEKLFILSNMRLYFKETDLQAFTDTVNIHKHYTLLIDGVEGASINGLKKIIVDKDLCVI